LINDSIDIATEEMAACGQAAMQSPQAVQALCRKTGICSRADPQSAKLADPAGINGIAWNGSAATSPVSPVWKK
jgi:hypothetical protein